jgi:hypothetical protein
VDRAGRHVAEVTRPQNPALAVGPQLDGAPKDIEELVLGVVEVQRDRPLGAGAVERHHRHRPAGLLGADGIRSAIRAQRLPEVEVIDTGIDGIGVFGRSPLTPEILAELPPLLLQGVIVVADRRSHRLLLGPFQPRQKITSAPRRGSGEE